MVTAVVTTWRPGALLGGVLAWAILQAQGSVVEPSTKLYLHPRTVHAYRSWSEWTAWSQCSRTCGGGVSVRTRVCRTRFGYGSEGFPQQCLGETTEYTLCRTERCPPYTADFRSYQCALHDGLQVAGRVVRHWTPFSNGPNPCELVCRAGHYNFHYTFGKAQDGTDCSNGGVCVNGRCMTVSCDGSIGGSTVDVDICGVCGGKNATCVHVAETFRGQPSRTRSPEDRSYEYQQVAVIPAGATHIKVTDKSSIYLALMDSLGTFVLNGNWRVEHPGVYSTAGTSVTYSRTWDGHEDLSAPGPTTTDLVLLVMGAGSVPNTHYEYWVSRSAPQSARTEPSDDFGKSPSRDRATQPPTRVRHQPAHRVLSVKRPEIPDVRYYGYRSVNRSRDPRTMYAVSQHPQADAKIVFQSNFVLPDPLGGSDKGNSWSLKHGHKARGPSSRSLPFQDRRKLLVRSHEPPSRNSVAHPPSSRIVPVNGKHVATARRTGEVARHNKDTSTSRRTGSCPPCPRVKHQRKSFCNSDFVLRVVVDGKETVGNQSRYELQVVQSYKNSVHILPREYLWGSAGCPCPRLRRNHEYIVMGRAARTGRRNESRLTVDRNSFVRRYSQKRSLAVMRLRRDQERLCRKQTS